MLKSELKIKLLEVIGIIYNKMNSDLDNLSRYNIEEEFNQIRYQLGKDDDYLLEIDIDSVETRMINILNDLKELKDDIVDNNIS